MSALVVSALVAPPAARAQEGVDPERMTAAERRRYYARYNASRTPAEWDSIRRATAATRTESGTALDAGPAPGVRVPPQAPVVSFRMRNRGLWTTRVEIVGNVLSFGPFETRYVQFPPGTRVHAYDARQPGGRGRVLFTVTRSDEGRAFAVRRE